MKLFFPFVALAFGIFMTSCNSEEQFQVGETQDAGELAQRASALDYTSAEEYVNTVRQQCRQGIHENCDILEDGTHVPCSDCAHQGTKCDGSHYHGSNHHGNTSGNGTCPDTCPNGNTKPGNGTGNGHHHGNCS